MSQQLADAEKYLAAGRKHVTKPSFTPSFLWSPDHDSAAQQFELAAGCFKSAQRYDLAVATLLDAALMWVKAGSYFMAAKNTESAASFAATQLKDHLRSAQLYKQAADYFVLNATPDRGAETLEKAAKAAEDAGDFQLALDMFKEAIELHEGEGRPRFAVDVNKRAVAFCLRANLRKEATTLLTAQIQLYTALANTNGTSKSTLSLILHLLSLGDTLAATQAFEQGMSQSQLARDEALLASTILDAIDQADSEALAKAVNSQLVTFLEQPIVRVARKITTEIALPVPKGPMPGAVAIPGFAPSGTAPPIAPATIPGFAPTPVVAAPAPAPGPIPGFTHAPAPGTAPMVQPPVPIPGLVPVPSAPAGVAPTPIPGLGASVPAGSMTAGQARQDESDDDGGIC